MRFTRLTVIPESKSMDPIARLQAALCDEHTGIVLVLAQAYRVSHSISASRLESLSRQQMRHFKWLGEHVVDGGGIPTLERAPIDAWPDGAEAGFRTLSAALDAAIARYETWPSTSEATDRLVARILSDKIEHRAKLARIWSDWRAQPSAIVVETGTDALPLLQSEELQSFFEFAIGHEYEVILQYLHHAFLLKDQAAGRVLEDVAIDEMQHLGWLSEMLIERGGSPKWDAKRLEYHTDAVRMLELDQGRELEVAKQYETMAAATRDAEVKALFERIRSHEDYHDGLLGELVTRLKSTRPEEVPAPVTAATGRCPYHGFTIGGLLGVSQGDAHSHDLGPRE
jgi:bacterioferritin